MNKQGWLRKFARLQLLVFCIVVGRLLYRGYIRLYDHYTSIELTHPNMDTFWQLTRGPHRRYE